MKVDEAEKCWNDFASEQSQSTPTAGKEGKTPSGQQDPGTVYFNDAGNGKTEVTMQLNPDGIAEGDEQTLNQRVDGFLNRFKQFVESR
jgi:nicotinamide mononucleotide (NMN) deamidase PncC